MSLSCSLFGIKIPIQRTPVVLNVNFNIQKDLTLISAHIKLLFTYPYLHINSLSTCQMYALNSSA